MFESPGRVAFYIAGYPVMNYGITIASAVIIAFFVLLSIRKKYAQDISEDSLTDLSFYVVIGGIIGARLWFVLLSSDYYFSHLLEIFFISKGGMSIHGAIAGGVLSGFCYVKKHNLNFFNLADLFAIVLPLGQSVGRWGNFFNSEAFGKPCNLPWKLYIPIEARPFEYTDFEYFHPTFLYESLADICIFLFLYLYFRRFKKQHHGTVFFLYLILYSLVRLVIEFIRTDSVLNIAGIPIAVIVSVLMFIVGSVGFLLSSRKIS